MKKSFALSLLAVGFAFAQSGLMAGSDGLHQQNAYTLGQWNLAIGVGGDLALDSWSLSRGGQYTANGKTFIRTSQAESTSDSIVPENVGVPVLLSISVRDVPVHAATP